MSGQVAELPGLGASLAASVVSLGVVCLLAWALLRWLAKRGGSLAAGSGGPIRVVARCALEPRRSVYLIEVAGRGFLVGVGEGGAMATLGEIALSSLPPPRAADAPRAFSDVLARALGRARARDAGQDAVAAEAQAGPPP